MSAVPSFVRRLIQIDVLNGTVDQVSKRHQSIARSECRTTRHVRPGRRQIVLRGCHDIGTALAGAYFRYPASVNSKISGDKSHCIWAKDRIGTGYWFRNQHELLLVGTRGNVPAPAMGTQIASLVDAPVGKHSAKPLHFYELIERYFPNLPKIELNARAAREGWDAWGYEAPKNEAAA